MLKREIGRKTEGVVTEGGRNTEKKERVTDDENNLHETKDYVAFLVTKPCGV